LLLDDSNETSVQTGLEKFVVFSEATYKRTDMQKWWESFLCGMCRSVRLLGVFETYHNVTTSCVMSVCLSVRQQATTRLPLDGVS